PGVQAAAGVAAVAGHNWSPYLGFQGGRGVAHAIGFMLAVSWPALGAFIAISLLGVRRKQIPQFVGLGILATPLVARIFGQPREIVRGLAAMAALIFAKRLLTNHPALPPGASAGRVLLNRLLYDRDTTERDEWVRRGLDEGRAGEGQSDG
ncbi:MAG: glycerol-3-phosphate acyltransferase, partial [Dehalococcoidia bacterium]